MQTLYTYNSLKKWIFLWNDDVLYKPNGFFSHFPWESWRINFTMEVSIIQFLNATMFDLSQYLPSTAVYPENREADSEEHPFKESGGVESDPHLEVTVDYNFRHSSWAPMGYTSPKVPGVSIGREQHMCTRMLVFVQWFWMWQLPMFP